MSVSATDAMQDVLESCSHLGFEMHPGFSTHWPMGSEAMIALGRPELASDWAARFCERNRHYDRPVSTRPIDAGDEAEWRSALGDWDRVADWHELFVAEIADDGWQEVLLRWWPRLIPGVSGGLTHGLIRSMHAVRSIGRSAPSEPSALQQRELAMGLAYWAAKHFEQPAALALRGDRSVRDAIRAIPRLDPEARMGLKEKGMFSHVHDLAGWGEAVEQLAAPEDVQQAFSELTLAFAQVHLSHPKDFPIPMVHTMTAPSAARQMLAHLPEELHALTFAAVWHSSAALLAMFAQPEAAETADAAPDDAVPSLTREQLAERATEHGDMHVLKLTDALLREHALQPDPRYLLVPERLMAKMPPFFRAQE